MRRGRSTDTHAYLPLDNERVMLKDMDNLNDYSVKFTLADIQILMCDKYVRVPLGGKAGQFPYFMSTKTSFLKVFLLFNF